MDKFNKVKYTHYTLQSTLSFLFDHVVIKVDEQISLHRQDTWELSYVIIGSGRRTIGDKTESFTRGEVVLIPPDIPHCWSFNESDVNELQKIENITLTFDTEFLNRCLHNFPELYEAVTSILDTQEAVSFGGSALPRLQELLQSMKFKTNVERLSIMIEVLSLMAAKDDNRFVGKLITEDRNAKRIRKVILYVMNNYHHTITLDDVAKIVDLDKSSFCVFFKKMTGQSFVSYLINYRIEVACQMFNLSDLNISEVCYACGFKDIPYFNRVFKKIKKVAPSAYKKIMVTDTAK